ncbi:hypothetical protein VNO78_32538 [Psophocarpus tetragonolobus]|uniref:Uncharacterized protein n=1 Tax=Psophocarpus tetragonolobus TaxID=3891 RepID=A0AAN9RPK2_PSOTE
MQRPELATTINIKSHHFGTQHYHSAMGLGLDQTTVEHITHVWQMKYICVPPGTQLPRYLWVTGSAHLRTPTPHSPQLSLRTENPFSYKSFGPPPSPFTTSIHQQRAEAAGTIERSVLSKPFTRKTTNNHTLCSQWSWIGDW